jgi:hypothetical protein
MVRAPKRRPDSHQRSIIAWNTGNRITAMMMLTVTAVASEMVAA